MNGIDPKWAFWLGVLIFLEQGIGQGTVKLTNVVPESWIPYVVSWCALLAWAGGAVQTALIGYSSKNPGPLTATPSTGVKSAIMIAILFAGLFAFPSNAQAQMRRPAVTGDPIRDIKTDLSRSGIKVPTVSAGQSCDFNLFAVLDPNNVVTTIQNCVSDASKEFLPDVQAALNSATAFKDQPGMACLTPALAIVKAAVGSDGDPSATPPVPAQRPGVILIFQKFREFTLAGGPAACKTWVNSTISGGNPLAN